MQDKLKEILKKASFITVHPDDDWAKICIGALLLLVLSLSWSGYFYFKIQSTISKAEEATLTSNAVKPHVEGGVQDELKTTIDKYDAKKSTYDSLLKSKPAPLADPATS